ncbi:MAG TPA: hypothetical protein VF950_26965 [Planctomycetota bacterium]
MIDRRAFLAAAPLVFGLDRLIAQEPGRPAWADAALRRMKDSGRFGLRLAVPEADPLQKRAGAALWSLTRSDLHPVRRLLAEVVLVCATRPDILGVRDERTLVLLSPDGRAIDGARIGLDVLEDGERFAAAAEALLAAEGRRAARAAEIGRGLSPELRQAIDGLDAENPEERQAALRAVAVEADRIAPLLAHLARTGRSQELRGRAAQALIEVYDLAKEGTFGPRLPYGARVPKMRQRGCGGLVEAREGDPDEAFVIKCGKAAVDADETRLFLRFLALTK